MGNHNYLLGQTLDLHSNRGERNPIFLSAWVIGGWSFYLWKFLKVSALLSSIWAARMSWEGSSAVLPPLPGWGPHTPLTPLTTSMVSEWPPRYSVWASRNSGQKTENRISSQIYFFLRSSLHSHSAFEFLLTVFSVSSPKWCVCTLIFPKGDISAWSSQRRWAGEFPWSGNDNWEPGDDFCSSERVIPPPFKHTSPGADTA